MPLLVTFDGEARSGKGTIVQATKDYLRETGGYDVMLIDRGQAFRSLVVAAGRQGVDMENPAEIDAFLSDENNLAYAAQVVKDVYYMTKEERDALLYTNLVGEHSAKIGARPASQEFVKNLTKKWLTDAGNEGYDVVLMDGRALEGIAREMHTEKICSYILGLYFTCEAQVGARRTLGYAATPYDQLSGEQRQEVDDFVRQIMERNRRDFEREVERLAPPQGAAQWKLPEVPDMATGMPPMAICDTSAEMSKDEMSRGVGELVLHVVQANQNKQAQ